jgi:hypothetical protein
MTTSLIIQPDELTIQQPLLPVGPSKAANIPQLQAVGFMALLFALLNNFDSVQDYVSNALLPMTEAFSQTELAYSNAFLAIMDGVDTTGQPLPGTDMYEMLHADKDHIGIYTSLFNLHNTQMNSATSFFQSMVQSGGDVASRSNDAASNDIIMLNNSALAIQQNLVASLRA